MKHKKKLSAIATFDEFPSKKTPGLYEKTLREKLKKKQNLLSRTYASLKQFTRGTTKKKTEVKLRRKPLEQKKTKR